MRVSDKCKDCGCLIPPYETYCCTCEDRRSAEREERHKQWQIEQALREENKKLKAELEQLRNAKLS